MTAVARNVLALVDEAGEALPEGLVGALADAGLRLHRATRADGLERLEAWLVDDAAPAAIVFAEHLEQPLAVSRQVRLIAPLVQQVFLVGRDRRDDLQRDMMLTRLIGSNWTFVDPDSANWADVVAAAVRATRQRSHLRTALDRMNWRLEARRDAAPDGERRLVVTDSFLASILEHAGDAIVAVDAYDRIATWNRGAALLFGRGEDEVLERPVDVLVPTERRAEFLGLVHGALAGRSSTRYEITGRRGDDSRFDAEVTVAPVKDADEEIRAVSVIVRDITRRKRHESSLHEANVRLKHALEELEAKTSQLVDLNAQLETLATTDALTGLKNRMVFQNSVDEMIAVASRRGSPLALLLVDIDHFKRVNDRLGHVVGDGVLQQVATFLRAHTRLQDIVARFGGEEFAILLPDTSAERAADVAETLRSTCGTAVDLEWPLTISVGVAELEPNDTSESLVRRADEALYASKRGGRDRVTLAGA